MKKFLLKTCLIIIQISENYGKGIVMRNNALMSKMVSHFQNKENHLSIDTTQKPSNVITLMQNVLCRNFPSIPCEMIVEDDMLRKLIEKSVQQIQYKKSSVDKTTPPPGYHLTLFPEINSEDLSNFLQVSDTGTFNNESKVTKKPKKIRKNVAKVWTEEAPKKKKRNKKESKRTSIYNGRKKIRKFYPHKIKYKDKVAKAGRVEFHDYSEEKLSMSVENPDGNNGHKNMFTYKSELADSVWRIDYMKHGEPSFNIFPRESDRMNEKIMKTGPNVIVDENVLEAVPRKDVLHPDVYIKNNFVRKNFIDSGDVEN